MLLQDLQRHLRDTGRYSGALDGVWGRLTEAGVLLMLTDGPDTTLAPINYQQSAKRTGCTYAQIRAVAEVESSGAGFFHGRPMILPEPHRFSKNTQHKFDQSNPDISYPAWGTHPYPPTQDARYDVLLRMIHLDVDAGFASASYGKFQIMGENYIACMFKSPMHFAEAQARDEIGQILIFESFLRGANLLSKLRICTSNPETCRPFCKGYNGTAYEQNHYHTKLAQAIKKFEAIV